MAMRIRPTSLVGNVLLTLAVMGCSRRCLAQAADAEQPLTTDVIGKVVDAGGEPADGAEVTFASGLDSVVATCDAEGRFQLAAPADRVRGGSLVARSAAGDLGFIDLPWELRPGEEPPRQEIALKPPRRLRVAITTPENTPAAGAAVVVHANYHTVARSTADAQGIALIDVPADAPLQFVLAEGRGGGVDYALFRRASAPKSDPFQLAHDYAGDINLTLHSTRTVTVRTVDQTGAPLANAEVTPWYIELADHGDSANLGSLWTRATDANGEVAYSSIPRDNTGGLVFWARKDGFVQAERTVLEPKSDDDALLATLLPLVPVRGRVVHVDGSPVAGIPVRAGGDGGNLDDFRGETTSAGDGTFRFGVHPDQYVMFAAGNKDFASPAVARIVRSGIPIGDIELKLGPTTRVHGRMNVGQTDKPADGEYITLYQKDVPSYYDLAENQRLPESASRFAVTPRLSQTIQTDANGEYEFFAGPGDYYIYAELENQEAPKFTITDQRELRYDLASKRALTEGKFVGRVVLASNPEQGVAGAKVFSYPEDLAGRHISATTDAQGRFEDRRPGSASLIGVFSSDKTLGAIVRIAAEDDEVTLALAPMATVTGKLVDKETDQPAGEREVGASIRVGPEDGPFMSAFRFSATTDAKGRFEVSGLMPGFTYKLDVVTGQGEDGRPNSWHNIGLAKPIDAREPLALDTLEIEAPYRPPTIKQYVKKAYGTKPPVEQLARLLADAKLTYQQVLVVAGDPNTAAVQQFFQEPYDRLYNHAANKESLDALFEFMILAIDPATGSAALDEYGIKRPAPDDVTLAILDADGHVASEWQLADLIDGEKVNSARLGLFLKSHRVSLPNAQQALDAALAEANRDDKKVLVQVGGPGCAWCVVLARFLHAQQDTLDKDYVSLKLDTRMPDADAVIGRLRPDASGGFPWMAILDADGGTLATSDAEDGNIGYPSDRSGRAHFELMLRTTRQRLSDADLAGLLKALADDAAK